MKTIRTLLLSGAALALSAQAGQKLNVPFPFDTTSGTLPAGEYKVEYRSLGNGYYVTLRNAESGSTVLVQPSNPTYSNRGNETPRAVFACGQAGCSLKQIWRNSVDGMDFRQRKLTPAEKERLAVVRIENTSAE